MAQFTRKSDGKTVRVVVSTPHFLDVEEQLHMGSGYLSGHYIPLDDEARLMIAVQGRTTGYSPNFESIKHHNKVLAQRDKAEKRCHELATERDDLVDAFNNLSSETTQRIDELERERDFAQARVDGLVAERNAAERRGSHLAGGWNRAKDRCGALEAERDRLKEDLARLREKLEVYEGQNMDGLATLLGNAQTKINQFVTTFIEYSEVIDPMIKDLSDVGTEMFDHTTIMAAGKNSPDPPASGKPCPTCDCSLDQNGRCNCCDKDAAGPTDTLAPCPNPKCEKPACGEQIIIEMDNSHPLSYFAECLNCYMRGARCVTPSAARAAWNGMCGNLPFVFGSHIDETSGTCYKFIYDARLGKHYYEGDHRKLGVNDRLAERVRVLINADRLAVLPKAIPTTGGCVRTARSEADLFDEPEKEDGEE